MADICSPQKSAQPNHVMKVMILVCKPGLTGKLSEVWEGLYQIEQM